MKNRLAFWLVNSITFFRLISSFALLVLLCFNRAEAFKWLLAVAFFTDAIDGLLARKLKVVSVRGSRLDSLSDDLTVLMGIIGIMVLKPGFFTGQIVWIVILAVFYLVQLLMAFARFGKPSSFHTVLAKLAAVSQGVCILLVLFLQHFPLLIFHVAVLLTLLELAEEIIITMLIPHWQADIKGLFWLWKSKQLKQSGS